MVGLAYPLAVGDRGAVICFGVHGLMVNHKVFLDDSRRGPSVAISSWQPGGALLVGRTPRVTTSRVPILSGVGGYLVRIGGELHGKKGHCVVHSRPPEGL